MTLAKQYDIFGGSKLAGDVVQKVTHILEEYPETREDYRLVCLHYWLVYDELLDQALSPLSEAMKWPTFRDWYMKRATSAKTIMNRCREIQLQRRDLAPSPAVQRLRKQQTRQGAIR